MKWYNYENRWINIENVDVIVLEEKNHRFYIHLYIKDKIFNIITYKSDDRDAEFEKIKSLMGVKDYTSRCC